MTSSVSLDQSVKEIINENTRRNDILNAEFNPISGKGSIGERSLLEIPDFPIRRQWIPRQMMDIPFVRILASEGSVENFIRKSLPSSPFEEARNAVIDRFVRIRAKFDFPFWAAMFVYIKNKNLDGNPEILFRLTSPQRKFVSELERQRLAGIPIRIVLLKARQWGGSTTSQLYMAWLQICHRQGLNSLIIAHVGAATDEIKDMFDRMIKAYPLGMLHRPGDKFPDNEPKLVGVGRSGSIFRIPQRNCKIKIGSAENPDSCRGGDYALVHLSEVGIWPDSPKKKATDIVRSACGGVLNKPGTMIVYESTANGHGNFFHHEYTDARDNPSSQFSALFIAWYEIDWNVIPFKSECEKTDFARALFARKDASEAPSSRQESGKYLWWLWQKGATLEAINWYVVERTKHTSHASMAAECPSDDIEAFVNSGAAVFDKYLVEEFRHACRPPLLSGEVISLTSPSSPSSPSSTLSSLAFIEDTSGNLDIWALPDSVSSPIPVITAGGISRRKWCSLSSSDLSDEPLFADRYLVAVDIGGRSQKADWSVIAVFDRIAMADGEPPAVVAQWRGHTDIDILAWKAAQIAAFYDNALLVIESNTIETHDPSRSLEGGDQSLFLLDQIRDQYPNLYARRLSPEDVRLGIPKKYGFHTNTATKPMIISGLIKAVREKAWVEADEKALSELLSYERKQNGAYGAAEGAHDDILMTRAIGLHICFKEMPLPVEIKRDSTKFLDSATRQSVGYASF